MIEHSEKSYIDAQGRKRICVYCLFREKGAYGLRVGEPGGVLAEVEGVTSQESKGKELYYLCRDKLVTGISLREVLSDLL